MKEFSKSLVQSKLIVISLWTIALGAAGCARPSPPVTSVLLPAGDCSCTAGSRSLPEPPDAVPPPADASATEQAVDSARPAPLAAASSASPEGLWEGVIFIQRGWLEVELRVELMQGGAAGWAGNADLPSQALQYIPLSQLAVEGRKVSFELHRPADGAMSAIDGRFEGDLSEDGQMLSGKFREEGKTFDFALERIGEAGMERPVPAYPDLQLLADRGDELKELFNREQDRLRLVILLSPT